ncbi:response regulator [Pelagicoccus sp. SDUM812002]|uniref:response regulator n=1 Tax=Pelagicoccus sp. SDUM812002 TaxID=3041266 RepID=UPI00280EA066|nr:response regulator [Pelagicoccus sp. SDUM812002]MDQ8186480.1 response regulator [Pelagicoccus sp. SDUM812002]
MNDKATILLIDDNPDDYEATERSFEAANFANPIQWCHSAKDGIDYLKRSGKFEGRSPETHPCLILLDLNMPGMDGRAALKKIKQDVSICAVPVIVLTTSSDEKDIELCYQLGASTYIQKPVEFNSLVAAVARMKDYWFEVALLPKVKS